MGLAYKELVWDPLLRIAVPDLEPPEAAKALWAGGEAALAWSCVGRPWHRKTIKNTIKKFKNTKQNTKIR